ncbi:MAG TPA: hypothetical protein VMH01_14450 [Puia sp.]|nr:hypothetical protein [Puia sp.]
MKTSELLMAASLLLAASARGTATRTIELMKDQPDILASQNYTNISNLTAYLPRIKNDNKYFFDAKIMSRNGDYRKKKYRVYNNEKYEIVESGSLFIYHRYESEELTRGKEMIKTDKYYFSKDVNSEIQPLTIENLKNAFPLNHKFHYAIDAEFRSDKELLAYDKYLKTYKIEYLYSQSLK